MHCIRRAALRTAIAASRQVAPKATASPLAQATLKTLAIPKQSLLQNVRCFSQTTRFQNSEQPTQDQNPEDQVTVESTSEGNAPQNPPLKTDRPPLENGLFIRNLIFDATEKHLESAFQQYGEIVEANIARDARGLSRGYGFVYFKDPKSVTDAINAVDGTFWHGRRITCSPRTDERRETTTRATKGAGKPTTTIYVGNIPYETTDAELNAIFRSLADVTDIRVAVDRTTGWPRGFAHADFGSLESAIKAYEALNGMQLGNRTLVVDYSTARSGKK